MLSRLTVSTVHSDSASLRGRILLENVPAEEEYYGITADNTPMAHVVISVRRPRRSTAHRTTKVNTTLATPVMTMLKRAALTDRAASVGRRVLAPSSFVTPVSGSKGRHPYKKLN